MSGASITRRRFDSDNAARPTNSRCAALLTKTHVHGWMLNDDGARRVSCMTSSTIVCDMSRVASKAAAARRCMTTCRKASAAVLWVLPRRGIARAAAARSMLDDYSIDYNAYVAWPPESMPPLTLEGAGFQRPGLRH